MVDGALLIYKRESVGHVRTLNMQCDDKEIPSALDDSRPVGWWLAERCSFTGTAAADTENDQLVKRQESDCEGTAALAVTAERVFGIIGPADPAVPAIWWSWSLPTIEVETDGEQGLFRKRPESLTLVQEDGAIELAAVSRLYRSSGRFQTGQEGSLLKALCR